MNLIKKRSEKFDTKFPISDLKT